MRIAALEARIEPDAQQQLVDVGRQLRARHEAVHERGLADDGFDAGAGIERGIRVLEDHLHGQACCPRLRAVEGAPGFGLLKRISPSVASRSPAIIRPSVDLPQPDSPTSPTTSPLAIGEVDAVDGVHGLRPDIGAQAAGDAAGEVGPLHEPLGQPPGLDQRRHDDRLQQGVEAAQRRPLAGWIAPPAARGNARSRGRSGGGRRSRRQIRQRGRHAGNLRERGAAPVVARHRADQAARIGMERAVDDVVGAARPRRCGRRT